jgi:protocatechuate 3,4-dioxygenase beta subunit
MRIARPLITLLFLTTTALAAPEAKRVAVTFEPAHRTLPFVSVRAAGATTGTTVRITNGTIVLPGTLAERAVIEADGFEGAIYSAAHGNRPLVLRALGTLTGKLVRKSTTKATFTWLLRGADAREPIEVEVAVGANQTFSLALPAGVYQGAVIGDGLASHIIPAIVIKAGETTEPRPITLEPTARATFRVVDKASGTPVRGARVEWSPPTQELNANSSRLLYSRRWSGETDVDGRVTFASVGPVPIPVRWRVEAPSYPSLQTETTQLRGDGRLTIADVTLKRPSLLTVRVRGPRHGDLPAATLTLLKATSDDGLEYRPEMSAPLKVGETVFRGVAYGHKRIQVVGKSGETLLYDDFRIESENPALDVVMEPVELFGTVTRGGSAVSGASVVFADPQDPNTSLVKTTSNFLGRYKAVTWKRGRLTGYAIEYGGAGKVSGNAGIELTVDATAREQETDFELPSAGLTLLVVNAVSNEPIAHAQVDRRIQFRDGSMAMGRSETDERGRLELVNYHEGTAKLFVQAKGYRTADVELALAGNDPPESRIALQPARSVAGRVLGPDGTPIAGAIVQGGYPGEWSTQAVFETRTDSDGSFGFESAPMVGTSFYAIASGYALGVTTLRAGDGNVIRLERPSNALVYLTSKDGTPPQKIYRMAAAPSGGNVIPIGALDDLARANGLTQFQLLGNGRDGSSILPEFLCAGSWDIFVTKRGGDPYILERIGNVATPLRTTQLLALRE